MSSARPDHSTQLEKESERLWMLLSHVSCSSGREWSLDDCRAIAPLTLEINQLKKEKNAIILAHSYVGPEIVYGVADFKSDSYALALEAKNIHAEMIIFAGVVFMAETAKLVCPNSKVYVPDLASGCSLADSLDARQLRELKLKYPKAAVVCYINSTAEVKAESDVCVTSSNVYEIVEKLPEQEILFVPDRLMADNLRDEMKKRGSNKIIYSSNGTCFVHDKFDPSLIDEQKSRTPGIKVVAHPECTHEVVAKADFVGSTGAMMNYVKKTEAPAFMMLTECGLVSRLEMENEGKSFVSSCKMCSYMKLNNLKKIRDVLYAPTPAQEITVDPLIAKKALATIDRMFEMTGAK